MALSVKCLCYFHHQTSDWLMKSKMVALKPDCQKIFCFDLHGKTLIFPCKSLTAKFDVKYFLIVSRPLLLLFWWTRGLVIRNKQACDIKLQVVPETRGPNFYDSHCRSRLCPTYKMALGTPKRRINTHIQFHEQ